MITVRLLVVMDVCSNNTFATRNAKVHQQCLSLADLQNKFFLITFCNERFATILREQNGGEKSLRNFSTHLPI
jgi:hypothetical protein